MRQNERANHYTNPVPSVMLYANNNQIGGNKKEFTPSKVWSPRTATANTGMRFQKNETSPDATSPQKSTGKMSKPRKSLPMDVSTLF